MTEKNLPTFSNICFWDQDYSKLNVDKNKKYIIYKVLNYGTQNDYIELFRYYGVDTIKEAVVNINYFGKKILAFLSLILEIDLNKFKAYNNNEELFELK
jgi:hypothetical protein